ncbi:histone deacetylase family protein [Sphingomonas sp. NSE70-1]|uniref:Histone deacetylase family protein n=1 Tax=Sphingomonas caseinilyticus TaxID=2908205 RepID=A0ABT0RXD7_9SPHN|nr:histone deacetylase family protein [Sphingomonas caseinilyticus]MCL6699694.1 histone deacetylase family protein [Sphingomonas caseinilyticus]
MITVPGYFDRRQLTHEPVQELHNGGWTAYAEKSSRAQIIANSFAELRPARDFGLEPLLNVHDRAYVEFLRSAYEEWRATGRDGDAIGYTWPVVRRRRLDFDRIDAKLGLYSYDAATPIAEGTWEASYWSAQTALSALSVILDGEAAASFALCRPPGHHSGPDYCGGYCYLNNAAIAAEQARRSGRRVAILDIDYHHGNGTQDIFYSDPDVMFVSIHADPVTDYPFFWGHADERGAGPGEGKTLNLPLPRGTDFQAYYSALAEALDAVRSHGADLFVLSFGADTFEEDPISHFRLRRDDYRAIGERIAAIGLPVLVVMEGGYAVDALGHNVEALLSGLEDDATRVVSAV